MKQYTVVVKKEHCIGTNYMDNLGCPLYLAIKEQLPDFPLKSVGGTHITDLEGRQWNFSKPYYFENNNGWGYQKYRYIMDGKINEFPVTFTLNQQ